MVTFVPVLRQILFQMRSGRSAGGDPGPANPPTYTASELDSRKSHPVSCVWDIFGSPSEAPLFLAGCEVIDEGNKGLGRTTWK